MRPPESIEHEPTKPDRSSRQSQDFADESGRTPNPGCHAPAVAQAAKPQHHTKVGHRDERKGVPQPSILNVGSCEPWCPTKSPVEGVLDIASDKVRAHESWPVRR